MDTIASRILEVDGEPKFCVRIRRPKPAAEGGYWVCHYEIAGPRTTRRGRVCGEDSMQALVLTLNRLAGELEVSEENVQGKLSWLGSRDFGLPSPPVIEPPVEGA